MDLIQNMGLNFLISGLIILRFRTANCVFDGEDGFHFLADAGDLCSESSLQLKRTIQKLPKLKFFAHSQTFWAEIGWLETPAGRYRYRPVLFKFKRLPLQEES